MISTLARNQNWAKAAPWLGVVASILLLKFYNPSESMFWALVNIPLYLFHQTEEHLWPGGFKDYINQVVNQLPPGEEALTDEKVFWINIILVWLAFIVFGLLTSLNLGFGLLIIIFSIVNCLTHIVEAIHRKRWNPGLVIASLQFVISLYAAYFISTHGLHHGLAWWTGTIIFSAVVHVILFRLVMRRTVK